MIYLHMQLRVLNCYVQRVRNFAGAFGIFLGCLLGMFPLLFLGESKPVELRNNCFRT